MDFEKISFTDVGLLKISESVRAYAYLILSSQASVRSGIVGNTASALTAQSAFLDNFENIVNCRVDIREDIKRYQDTLSYASSKVNYSMGQNIYMLPSDMKLKIRLGTVGYNTVSAQHAHQGSGMFSSTMVASVFLQIVLICLVFKRLSSLPYMVVVNSNFRHIFCLTQ